eukprot:4043615-Lingulodinium_polyedra.AAC.1
MHEVRDSRDARRRSSDMHFQARVWQLSRESCSDMRSGMHSIVAAPRISRCARSMRRPPRGG